MSQAAGALTPGFAQPVHDAQRVFRAVLEAMARPLQPQRLEASLAPPAPLSSELGAVTLALCDEHTPLWCDAALRGESTVEAWIRFHTGARLVEDPGQALFCLASRPSAVPLLEELDHGTDEEPHRSATVIVDTGRLAAGSGAPETGTTSLTASGPGIQASLDWGGAGLPTDFLRERNARMSAFPRGVDVLMTGADGVVGLPRTTVLTPADSSVAAPTGNAAEKAVSETELKGDA